MKISMRLVMAALMLAAALPVAAGDMPKQDTKSDPGFEKLKSLVGEWRGDTPKGGEVRVSYELTAGGSVLMETLAPPEGGEMVTMYSVDGKRLLLTHYCMLGNQPRMSCAPGAADAEVLKFKYVDGANMASKDAKHMHNLTIRFVDADHFVQEWTLRDKGKDQVMPFHFERIKS